MVTVNLSQSELRSPNLSEDVRTILVETGLPPGCLILEITESSAMQDPAAAIDTLGKLRDLGVRLALDDFGTGYSSLSHLNDFPIHMLKIAKPFVDRIDQDSTFVEAILGLRPPLISRSSRRASRRASKPKCCANSGACWARGTTTRDRPRRCTWGRGSRLGPWC